MAGPGWLNELGSWITPDSNHALGQRWQMVDRWLVDGWRWYSNIGPTLGQQLFTNCNIVLVRPTLGQQLLTNFNMVLVRPTLGQQLHQLSFCFSWANVGPILFINYHSVLVGSMLVQCCGAGNCYFSHVWSFPCRGVCCMYAVKPWRSHWQVKNNWEIKIIKNIHLYCYF